MKTAKEPVRASEKRAAKAPRKPRATPAKAAAEKAPREPRTDTKKAKVLAMLQRPEGASLAEIMEATGWQKHTSSAFLTHQRKSGAPLVRTVEGDRSAYRLNA